MMTVSHVFLREESACYDNTPSNDSDYAFGSDEDDEDDGDLMETTSRASMSSAESQDEDLSVTPDEVQSMELDETILSMHPDVTSEMRPVAKELYNDSKNVLQKLGTVCECSIDQDWALVKITSAIAKSKLEDGLVTMARVCPWKIAIKFAQKTVVIHTNNTPAGIKGLLHEEPSYLRFPQSRSLQPVYHISLEQPLEWGDCGSFVLDPEGHSLYGHIVASSQDQRTALIIPADLVMQQARTSWSVGHRLEYSPATRKLFLRTDVPAFSD